MSSKKKICGSRHQRLFEENIRKKPKRGMRILKIKVRELFTHREGISTPHVCHKGQQPLIECAKCDFKIMYFPLFYYYYFLSRQGCCPCFYVSPSAMRKSYLHSSLSLNACVLNWFYIFWNIYFNCEQRVIKVLDLEMRF